MYAVHVREDEVDDERRPSAMVRGSLSRFTIIVQNDILAQSKKKKREREKKERKKRREVCKQTDHFYLPAARTTGDWTRCYDSGDRKS